MPPDLELAKERLDLAQEDLDSAREALASTKPTLRVACYLSQQAVEKSLKAFLQYSEVVPPKTHSLDLLFDMCAARNNRFAELRAECAWLGDYAVGVRYPGFELKPMAERPQQAAAAVGDALKLALTLLPKEALLH